MTARSSCPRISLLALTLLAGLLLHAGPLGAEEEAPAEKKASPLDALRGKIVKLLKGSYPQKLEAVQILESQEDQPQLGKLLFGAINACKGNNDLKLRLAQKLITLKADPEVLVWVERGFAAEGKTKNADSNLVAAYLKYLIKAESPRTLGMVEGILPNLAEPGPLFSALFDSGKPELIELVGKYAVNPKIKAPPMRRFAIDYLGKFWAGPPCFKARVPYLLKAMEKRDTREAALRALQKICLPNYTSRKSWKKWWAQFEAWDDLKIIYESFRDAFERVSGVRRKNDGAKEIMDYIKDWSKPYYAWALPVLHKSLLRFEHRDLKEEILYTLGKIRQPESLDVVYELRETPSGSAPYIQQQIAKTIGNIAPKGDSKAGKTLMSMYENTMTTSVRREIIRSLGKIRHKTKETVNLLIEVMREQSGDGKNWSASEALGEMRAVEAIPAMVELFQGSEDNDLRLHILRALRKMKVKTEEVFSIALAALDADDFRLQDAGIHLLREYGDARAIPNLHRFFGSKDHRKESRKLALEALTVYPPDKVYEIFIEALQLRLRKKRNGIFVKKHVLNELNQIAAEYFEKDSGKNLIPDMLDPLLDLLKDQKSNGRLKAVKWIGDNRIWKDVAISVMVSLFDPHNDDKVIEQARDNLIKHPKKDTFGLLLKKFYGVQKYEYQYVDMQIAYVLRKYVEISTLADPDNPLNSPDHGTDKRAWKNWWRKYRSKFKLLKPEKKEVKKGKGK